MIILSIKGRLGNQMFQYAMARAIQEKTKQDILIDWHYVNQSNELEPGVGYINSLKDFNVKDFVSKNSINYREKMSFLQYCAFRKYDKKFPYKGDVVEKKIFEEEFLGSNINRGLFFFENGYYCFDEMKITKNIFLNGYFESMKYFKDIEKQLKEEFVPIYPKMKHNLNLYNEIENSESVCVTIRRGDFSKSSFHNVCRTEYFLKGMDIIKEKIPNAKFFIFSDSIDWIKENIEFKYPVLFEEGNDPVWEKLRLMYSCKHFVISNSTFSWWAQYLSKNENKVVVAPDRWYNSELKSDLLNDSNMIKIECK